jgi:hypothetical protein
LLGWVHEILVEPPDAVIFAHQRSGTHLLQSSLASHPQVHGRGEFVLLYKRACRRVQENVKPTNDRPLAYVNKPHRLNIGIVMYSEKAIFEGLCGPLSAFRVIHLLREPLQVATSVAQMEADRAALGEKFRAHYNLDECPPAHAEYSTDRIAPLVAKVAALQEKYVLELRHYPRVLTVSYEEITAGKQVAEIPAGIAHRLLGFLELKEEGLRNTLRKTGL